MREETDVEVELLQLQWGDYEDPAGLVGRYELIARQVQESLAALAERSRRLPILQAFADFGLPCELVSFCLKECSMSHVDYPPSFPGECLASAIGILRNRELLEKKAEFGKHAWNIQGYAQKILLGDPTDDGHQASMIYSSEQVDVLEVFASELADYRAQLDVCCSEAGTDKALVIITEAYKFVMLLIDFLRNP